MPLVSFFSAATLEWNYPPIYERPPEAQAIVVLGSGVSPADTIRKKAELDQGGIRRCVKAAELYSAGKPCPIVVTGGRVESYKTGPVMAEVMRDFLIRQGVSASDIILENESRSTYENATQAAKLLKQ
ncbi:MAG: YdcF family protein, partial [Planctomycetota bacterium]|nr:YdcF family protein [Planctomycetota bacterium]